MLKNYAVTIAISSIAAFFLLYFLFAYSGIMLSVESGYKIGEISSIFKNRSRGKSNVNLRLIFGSLKGLLNLFLIKIKKK